LPFDASLFRI